MKKQLLTALLAFTPFFAFSNEEISKRELLMHLKQCKTDALYMLYNHEKDINAIQNGYVDWSTTGFKQMINIWNDLINAMDPSQKQVAIDAEICFNLICQKQKNIASLLDNNTGNIIVTIAKIINSEDKNFNDPQIKKNYTLVFSTLAKHLRYPWYTYFNDCLKDSHLEEDINSLSISADFFCMGCFVYETKVLRKLLPKLDTEIIELETQV